MKTTLDVISNMKTEDSDEDIASAFIDGGARYHTQAKVDALYEQYDALKLLANHKKAEIKVQHQPCPQFGAAHHK